MRRIAMGGGGVVLLACLVVLPAGVAEGRKTVSVDDLVKSLSYPGAERYDDSPGGGGIRHARYATKDRTADVSKWYRKALDYDGADHSASAGSAVLFNPIRDRDSGYRASVQYVTRAPGKKPGDFGTPRPVYESVVVKRTLSAIAVVVISRGKDEDRTYITLTVIDNAGK